MAVDKTKKSHVSEEKKTAVKELAQAMKEVNTLMLVSSKSVPAAQFQKIKKSLREKANVQVAKKSTVIRALDETKLPGIEALKEHVQADYAILLSNTDGFELSGWLNENKNPIGAKEGQIADADITIEAGPTDLVPGPVISELGALGLQIMVEDGKITIRKAKAVVKTGEKVSGGAASILQKLGIKPFMMGINPIAFYDKKSGKIYAGVKIDKKKMLEDFLLAHAKAVGFAVNLAYPSQSTIGMLLAKANAHHSAISKLQTKSN
jgi:large subunit ribosomal protein L10